MLTICSRRRCRLVSSVAVAIACASGRPCLQWIHENAHLRCRRQQTILALANTRGAIEALGRAQLLAPSSLRWFHQETHSVFDHEDITVSVRWKSPQCARRQGHEHDHNERRHDYLLLGLGQGPGHHLLRRMAPELQHVGRTDAVPRRAGIPRRGTRSSWPRAIQPGFVQKRHGWVRGVPSGMERKCRKTIVLPARCCVDPASPLTNLCASRGVCRADSDSYSYYRLIPLP